MRRVTSFAAALLALACTETTVEPHAGRVDAAADASDAVPSEDASAGADAAVELDAGWGPGPTDAGRPDGGIDCGPHGTSHGNHCHCYAGYVERERRCVPVDECLGDDPYEPDDRPRDAVPWEGEPMERWLCPGDRDHVDVELEAGDALRVMAFFSHDEVDIDLALWTPGRDPRFDGPAVQALSRTDDEVLTHVATRDGRHLIRIFSSDRGAQGAYRLEIAIDPRAD